MINSIFEEINEKFQGDKVQIRQLNPLILASVGDAVYSLYMRTHLVATQSLNAKTLHLSAAEYVRASAQCAAYHKLEPYLSEDELYIAKRGRNSHPSTIPKSAELNEYRTATAVEALFGYLYLLNDTDRIDILFRIILEK